MCVLNLGVGVKLFMHWVWGEDVRDNELSQGGWLRTGEGNEPMGSSRVKQS